MEHGDEEKTGVQILKLFSWVKRKCGGVESLSSPSSCSYFTLVFIFYTKVL